MILFVIIGERLQFRSFFIQNNVKRCIRVDPLKHLYAVDNTMTTCQCFSKDVHLFFWSWFSYLTLFNIMRSCPSFNLSLCVSPLTKCIDKNSSLRISLITFSISLGEYSIYFNHPINPMNNSIPMIKSVIYEIECLKGTQTEWQKVKAREINREKIERERERDNLIFSRGMGNCELE